MSMMIGDIFKCSKPGGSCNLSILRPRRLPKVRSEAPLCKCGRIMQRVGYLII